MPQERIRLDDHQLLDRSKSLAFKVSEKLRLQREAKRIAKEYKNQIEDLDDEIKTLSETVRTGAEYREAKPLFNIHSVGNNGR